MIAEFAAFAVERLAPAAADILRARYDDHVSGRDIGIETKSDASPASLADREAEQAMRDLIATTYPDHGIWGEEFGADGLERDWVWVLDPLDGTRAFLAQQPGGFGILIGLCHKGIPVFGLIHDPIGGELWRSDTIEPAPRQLTGRVSCTAPQGMFQGSDYEQGAAELFRRFPAEAGLNCIGFALVAESAVDLAVEADLRLHDIAALIPVLAAAGATVIDFDGRDYRHRRFDPAADAERKLTIIAARDAELAQLALTILQGKG